MNESIHRENNKLLKLLCKQKWKIHQTFCTLNPYCIPQTKKKAFKMKIKTPYFLYRQKEDKP